MQTNIAGRGRGRPRLVRSSEKKRRRSSYQLLRRQTNVSLLEAHDQWQKLSCSSSPAFRDTAQEPQGSSYQPGSVDDKEGTSGATRHRQSLSFSSPMDPGKEMHYPSDVSALDDSSETDSGEEGMEPIPESDEEIQSCLDQNFVDKEVFNFNVDVADGDFIPESLAGRMTGDCTSQGAVDGLKCVIYNSVFEDLVRRAIPSPCPTSGCTGQRQFSTTKRGTCAVVSWKCTSCGSRSSAGTWASQPRVGGMYAGNILLAAAVLLSGNSFHKVAMMCKFANLWFPSQSYFTSLQSLYLAPVVHQFWEMTREKTFSDIEGAVILAGDGRMDSPGHCAQYCTYSLMNHSTHAVHSLHCVDVRQAKNSHDMERVGFMRAMEDLLKKGIKISEVVTDAHVQIKSIMKKTEIFKNIEHQTDIWHASKSLMKKLLAASKKKHCDVIAVWMPSIRNHFWYSCLMCEGDLLKLKEVWVKVAQHVCNRHEWVDLEGFTDGRCDHGPLPEEHSKPWIIPHSPAHMELLGVIFDKNLMRAMPYYRNFRHTSQLESFHNHILMYATKRMSFSYTGYALRNELAAIDFNEHRNRDYVRESDGTVKHKSKYSKATKQWHPTPVRVPKEYHYIPDLLKEIVEARLRNPCPIGEEVTMPLNDPRSIRPRISTVPRPPMEELLAHPRSRLSTE